MKKAKSRAQRRRAVRNVLLAVSMMMMLMIVTVGGTVAWLTASTETVTNTFTPSDIDITLAETVDDEFKMVPGVEMKKDPVVTVLKGSEPCWVFVTVDEIAATFPKVGDAEKPADVPFASYISYAINEDDWTKLEDGVYYYKQETLTESDTVLPEIIEGSKITVNSTVTKEMMDVLQVIDATNPMLSFKAYAIQLAKFDTAAAAWDELKPNP